jgi:hypothetical protein
MRNLPDSPQLALLETPAGFELNSSLVTGRVADFIQHRLQNFHPQIQIVPARKRGTEFSPDNPLITEPLLGADLIFMGPGSPTYAVRQLRDSLAWYNLLARHRMGAGIAFASAAVIAISAQALPVYEIFKVGEDLHWKPGLDLFEQYGLKLVFVPHWNNKEGGEELDTSRCFMGKVRFMRLMQMLPPYMTVVGIDEHTALIMDPAQGSCQVIGSGGVTLIHIGPSHMGASTEDEMAGSGLVEVAHVRDGHVHQYQSGESFPLIKFGTFVQPDSSVGLPQEVWQRALYVQEQKDSTLAVPLEVRQLADERQTARQKKDWVKADALRDRITELGWQVLDTPDGPQLNPAD